MSCTRLADKPLLRLLGVILFRSSQPQVISIKFIPARDTMVYQTTNPYTGEVVKTFPDATDAEVTATLDNAHQAFQQWRETSFEVRAKVMQKAADLLRAQSHEMAPLLTLEMGKILAEANAEVELCAQIFEYYARHSHHLLAPQVLKVADPTEATAQVVHEPLGILLAIEPWNFPYYQIARIIAPQLSAGNVVILKHASNVPQCAARFEKLMLDAGLPDFCFRNLYATRPQINRIIADPRVHGVALTGSEAAGSQVAMEAARALKKSTMELGGADAFIVLEDADMEKTVRWAVFGRHWNAGQVCCSSKRMIVVSKVYDEFVERYTAGVAGLRAGDPMDPNTQLAPLSSKGAADEVRAQIQEAVASGANAIEVGAPVPSNGSFVQPTILLNVKPGNPVYYQEIFGPVSMVLRAADEVEAVAIANDSPYGLGGSVFTRDEARGAAVAAKVSTGMVFVNQPTRVKADLPFGGVRRSGYGRELIDLGIKEFVNHKLISVVNIDANF